MEDALKLAVKGIGSVEPNPAVGCVIVKGGQAIGKGCHKKFGGPHAEINALEDCKTLGANPKDACLYVTLEPCCHMGKTGPCTQAIIEAQVSKVYVAMVDPSVHAAGKGIEQLRQAGIEVEIGLCEEQAKLLNAPFIKFATTHRCWTVLKWAQSIDGKLARTDGKDRWISSELSRKDVHKLRSRVQAILVGIGTVLADDPQLTVRTGRGKKLTKVVLDSHLRIPLDCQLVKSAKKEHLVVYAYDGTVSNNNDKKQMLIDAGVEIVTFGDLQDISNLNFVLDDLSKRRITQLLVEGGPTVLSSFLREGLADELCVYIAPVVLGGTGTADVSSAFSCFDNAVDLHNVEIKTFNSDTRITGLIKP